MTHSQKTRLWVIGLSVSLLALGLGLIVYAMRAHIDVYVLPKQIQTMTPDGRHMRLGGFVKKGSLSRRDLDLDFLVHDDEAAVQVFFHGLPPALFREGQGVLAEGRWLKEGFLADRILAKHDENYRPPGSAYER